MPGGRSPSLSGMTDLSSQHGSAGSPRGFYEFKSLIERGWLYNEKLALARISQGASVELFQSNASQAVLGIGGLQWVSDGQSEVMVDPNQIAVFAPGRTLRVRHSLGGGSSCVVLAMPGLSDISRRRGTVRMMTPSEQLEIALLGRCIAGVQPCQVQVSAGFLNGLQHAFGAEPIGERSRSLISAAKILLLDSPGPINLADIAQRLDATATYLTHLFRRVEGAPMYQYHLRLRLAEALKLAPDYDDLTELALDLGFSSHSHFTKAFRDCFGLTPSRFRALARGDTERMRAAA